MRILDDDDELGDDDCCMMLFVIGVNIIDIEVELNTQGSLLNRGGRL